MAEPGGGWTEHKAPDGRVYYYHKARGVSTYDKPAEMKSAAELAAAKAAASWKEYTTPAGKKYYFNTETRVTTWETPAEVKAAAEAAEAAAAAAAANRAAAEAAAAAAALGASGAFKKALDDSGVREEMEWEEAMKLVIHTEAYRGLPTLAERKAAFGEWKAARADGRAEEQRRRERQLKVDFLTMLKECRELTSRTRYHAVVELFGGDPRWQALGDELEREELFEEYALSLERKEAAERRDERKAKCDAFRALLGRHGVTSRSQWRRVSAELDGEAAYRALDKIDRLATFEEVVRELEASDEQARHAEQQATRRDERRARDAFRALLSAKHDAGEIGRGARWRDVVGIVKETPEYRGAREQSGSTPLELFEDFLDQLEETARAQRRTVRAVHAAAAAGPHADALAAAGTFEQFERALRLGGSAGNDGETLEGVPQSALREFHEELLEKARRAAEDDAKRAAAAARKLRETWQGALRGLMGAMLSSSTTWEEAAATMKGKAASKTLSEADQRVAFDELLAEMRGEDAKEEAAAAAAAPPPPPAAAAAAPAVAPAAADDAGAADSPADEGEVKEHKRKRKSSRSKKEAGEEDGEEEGGEKKKRKHKKSKKELD